LAVDEEVQAHNMNYSEVCLKMIDKLKDIQTTLNVNSRDLINFVPISVIQSLIDRLNLCKAEIRINTLNNQQFNVRKVLGKAHNLVSQEQHVLKLTLRRTGTDPKAISVTIGEIILFPQVILDNKQKAALDTFNNVLCDYISLAINRNIQSRIKIFSMQIVDDIKFRYGKSGIISDIYDDEDIDIRAKRKISIGKGDAGSLVHYFVNKIHGSCKCHAAYFGIIHNNNIFIDYAAYNKNDRYEIIPKQEWIELLDDFSTNYNKFNLSIQPLNKILKHVNYKSNWFSILLIIENDSVPICAFILQVEPENIFIYNHVKNLLEIIKSYKFNEYKYLYQRRAKQLIVAPIFVSRETRMEASKVFVLMPFTGNWTESVWEFIQTTIDKTGLVAVKANNRHEYDIMEDIWKGILTSRIIIADLTGNNPNVAYELGIAHTIGKDFIIISQGLDDIPYNLRRYHCIRYENSPDGLTLLESELITCIRKICER